MYAVVLLGVVLGVNVQPEGADKSVIMGVPEVRARLDAGSWDMLVVGVEKIDL